jgi:ATP-dependent Clp protease protease subunit
MDKKKTTSSSDSFVWVKEFDDSALESFYNSFMSLEHADDVPVIPVIISSYGGEVSALLAMRDIIKSSNKPVSTIALGKAMSAGACLLAAGTKGLRYASPDTIIMIHEVSSGVVGKAADIKESAATIEMMNRKLLKNLAADCDIPLKKLDDYMRSIKNVDWNMTSQQALKLGLIDSTSVPRILSAPGTLMLGIPQESMQDLDMYGKKRKRPSRSKPAKRKK